MQGVGIVKGVLSGDTVILQGTAPRPGAPAPELQLSLAHLSAPRISRHSDQRDEPFGWPSREFLRKALVGRQVRFKVDYKVEKIGRSFATLWLTDGSLGPESVNVAVARNGWAKVNPSNGPTKSDEYDALVAVGKEAEDNGVGMHNKTVEGLGEATIRSITWSLTPTDAVAVADVLKASPQPAIVESVMNGGNLRVLLTATAPSLSVPLNVLGIMAPKVDASALQKPVAPSAAPAATSTAPTTKGVKVTRGDSAPGSALVHDATDGAGAGGAPKMTWAKSGAVAAVAPTAAAARPGAAGAAAPAAAAAAMPTTEPAIGLEAKAWVEARFLHRDVLVHIVGADARSGSLYGRIELVPPQAGGAGNPSVVIPAGFDLAVELLKQGMAKLHDWSLNQFAATTSAGGASSYSAQLRAAERQAKQNKLRLWHSYSGSDSSASAASRPVLRGETQFEGRVVEVVSGDTVVVAVPPKAGSTLPEERRVNLASVRAPRMGRPGGDAGQPYSVEAKEFLRRNLVGRDVVVEINYTRVVGAQPAQAGAGGEAAAAPAKEGQERQFATITFSTKKGEETDISVLLVAEGLAEAIRHRAAEVEAGERATHYEELLAAEEQAKAAKKNLHSGKEPQSASSKAIKPLDLSSDAAKAKNHLPFLKRAGTVTANVEFVFGGGRVKVTVPSENCSFVFGVAGVRCPAATAKAATAATKGPDAKPAKPARAAEPFGPEALSWMRLNTLQQQVEIECDETDKNGTILGSMWIGKGGSRRSVGVELLRQGLGQGIHPLLDRGSVKESSELLAAEAEAKASKRGVWENYVEPVKTEEDEDAEAEATEGDASGEATEGGAEGKTGDFPSLGGAGAAASSSAGAGKGGKAAGGKAGADATGTIAEIVDGSTFYLHFDGSDSKKLAEVSAKLASMQADVGTQCAAIPGEGGAKKGKVVAVTYADPAANGALKWLRARIDGKRGDGVFEVTFIDYGTKDTEVTAARMRPLPGPESGPGSLAAIPALAKEATLAYVRVPGLDKEYGADAANFISDAAYGRKVMIRTHATGGFGAAAAGSSKLSVSLWDIETKDCLQEALVAEGLARIARTDARRVERRAGGVAGLAALADKGDKDADLLKRLHNATAIAKKDRVALFAYGDPGDSDDEKK